MSAAPPAPMGAGEFARLANVSRETTARLAAYLDLLRAWSRGTNLVGASSLADPWRRHMLDSAQLARFVPAGADRVVDIGSGAGFPGLVLALALAERGVRVDLIEVNSRKAAFLAAAVRETGAPARVHRARAESAPVAPAPAVTARACAPLPKLLAWARPLLAPGGRAVLPKGRRAKEELTAARRDWKMTVARRPSMSDPSGVILIVENLERAAGR